MTAWGPVVRYMNWELMARHAPVDAPPPIEVGGAPSWGAIALQGIRTAFDALVANGVRSVLTMIGIVIGVCGVLVIDAVGQSQSAQIASTYAQLGSNVIAISTGSASIGGVSQGAASRSALTRQDADAIRRRVPHVVAVSPAESGQTQVVYGDRNTTALIQGAYPDIQVISSYSVHLGRFFTAGEESAASYVAVIGQTIVDALFPKMNPIGQQIRIRNANYQVVGVFSPKGNNGRVDLDDVAVIPFSAGQKQFFGYGKFDQILVQADQTDSIPAVIAGITQTVEDTHRFQSGSQDDFAITNDQAIIDAAKQQTARLTNILVGVAIVALAMGGFGVMSIMFATVTERTREIGIRMAVGAEPAAVLLQFLAEGITLSLVGGAIGIVCGFAASIAVQRFVAAIAQFPRLPSPGMCAIALGVSLMIGAVSSFYPARRAARMDLLEALRYE